MINQIPSPERPYNQINRGDKIGSIWSSMNLDFQSNYGVMRLAPRTLLNLSSTDDADLKLPLAFTEFGGALWALCGTTIFRTNTSITEPNEAFSEDNSTGAVKTYSEDVSDMVVFDNRLFASNNAGLYAKSSYSGAWAVVDATPNAGLLQYFRKLDRLYISEDTNSVQSISNADVYAGSGDYTITLPAGYIVTCMCETMESVWIGTLNTENLAGRGSIFQWDGISAQAINRYYVEANEICSMVVLDDVPYAMDSSGLLTKFTGSSFDEVGRIPFLNLPKGTSTSSSNPRFVNRHGMVATKNKTILALIRNIYEDATDSIPENVPSGVWEWSEDFGFTHKYSVGYTPRETTTITDWGQNRLWEVGALANMSLGNDGADANGSLLLGANYYTDSTTSTATSWGIFYNDSNDLIQKKGYFVTSWMDSTEIQDKWSRLWGVYKRFLNSTDKIVFKYRIVEEDPVVADITWVNTTSFTTSTNITGYGPTATGFNGTQGGEVEFIQGVGSGLCAHITAVSGSGPYTVTIDETATGATTTTGKARFQKWIKLNPATAQNQIAQYSQYAVGASSPDIQIKCCMTFTGKDEFTKLALVSNEDIKISP